MKHLIFIAVLILLSIPALTKAGTIGPARIRLVDGEVMFRTPDSGEWLPAAINTPLDEGDATWCPDGSRAEIQLSDGTLVRLDGGTQLDMLANEESFTHLHLASGRLYVRTAQNSAKNSLQIDADDTTVIPEGRTRLRIDMLPKNQEDVAIFKGTAYVEGNGSRTKVRAGDHIALEEGHSELLPLNTPDGWETWNVERDRLQSRNVKANTYLPDELKNHSAELEATGSWVQTPEYGMVWRPNVDVAADWSPYRSGRWIWKGDDYVWVSYERWGWVPYHYGRWAAVSGFGWCWVPPLFGDVYWGPGYVGWYRTGSHVGWTPLAPGELFYGYGRYGRHSVNISNSTISNNTIVYRNRNIQGGLTMLPNNDFLRGNTIIQHYPASSSLPATVSVGSPRIQPQRETRMPIVKQTPPKVLPPKNNYQDSRELRQQFHRVTPQPTQQRPYQQSAPVASSPTIPANSTPVKEKRVVHPVPPTQVSPPQQAGQQHRNDQPGTKIQKKVWKVTTPEESKENDNRGKELKGKEFRNKQTH